MRRDWIVSVSLLAWLAISCVSGRESFFYKDYSATTPVPLPCKITIWATTKEQMPGDLELAYVAEPTCSCKFGAPRSARGLSTGCRNKTRQDSYVENTDAVFADLRKLKSSIWGMGTKLWQSEPISAWQLS
jgi:hypothetical protein